MRKILLAPDAKNGNALVDETNGDLLYINPCEGWLFRSRDNGATWTRETCELRPDGFGLKPGLEGVGAMQAGITLAFGARKGRLLSPARIMGPKTRTMCRGVPTTTVPRFSVMTVARCGRPVNRSR